MNKKISLILFLFLLSVSCSDEKLDSKKSLEKGKIEICQTDFSKDQLKDMLNGHCIIAAGYQKEGSSLNKKLLGLILALVLYGVDFETLFSHGITYENSWYSIINGDQSFKFAFTFLEDFGNYKSGELIPYNLFSADTYVTNILFDGNSVSYTNGPLFNLISGSITFTGVTPKIRLSTGKIGIEIHSKNSYKQTYPSGEYDQITINMKTAKTSITNFYDQVNSEGFGFSYDSTIFISTKYDVVEVFYNSLFYLKKSGENFIWEGYYSGNVIKSNSKFYLEGLASNRVQNYTSYFCDEKMTTTFGKANHDLSLNFGYFQMLNGDTINYRLE